MRRSTDYFKFDNFYSAIEPPMTEEERMLFVMSMMPFLKKNTDKYKLIQINANKLKLQIKHK